MGSQFNLSQEEVNAAMTKAYGTPKNFAKAVQKYGLGAALSAAFIADASAAGTTIEVTDVITTITNGVTTVSAIGIAVLSLVVVIKVFKWARSAM